MTDILTEAHGRINGQRATDYGDAAENFARVWQLWQPILASDMPGEMKVPLCLAQLKLARLCASPGHRDSLVDLAGYAALAERVQPGAKRRGWRRRLWMRLLRLFRSVEP